MVNSNSQDVLKTKTGLYFQLMKKNKEEMELVAVEVQEGQRNVPHVRILKKEVDLTGEKAQTERTQEIWMALCFPHNTRNYLLKVDGERMMFEQVADPIANDLGDDYWFQQHLKIGEHYTLRAKVSQRYICTASVKKAHLIVTMSGNPVYVTHLNNAE